MTSKRPVKAYALAEQAIEVYAEDARRNGARLLTYTDMALMLGKSPSYARSMGPMLAALRQVCIARGLPDLCAVIVASGTVMPSRKSFQTLSGTWCDTGLDEDGVRAEQARIFALDWTSLGVSVRSQKI